MKLLRLLLLGVLIPTVTFAQRGGGARGGGGGGFRGGGGGGARVGGGGFAGGGIRGGGGGFRGGGFAGGGFRGGNFGGFRGGGFRGGFRDGFGRGFRGNRFFFGAGFGFPYYYGGFYGWPYYDPYFYGSYYDPYSYDPGYYGGYYGPSTVSYAPPAQPVVIEQNIGRTAPQPQPSEPFYRPADFYLIAFNDHTIRAALSYTVQDDTIHWTSREHEEMSAPLSTVDRRFSEQINRDRHVEFRLP